MKKPAWILSKARQESSQKKANSSTKTTSAEILPHESKKKIQYFSIKIRKHKSFIAFQSFPVLFLLLLISFFIWTFLHHTCLFFGCVHKYIKKASLFPILISSRLPASLFFFLCRKALLSSQSCCCWCHRLRLPIFKYERELIVCQLRSKNGSRLEERRGREG